ncbi:hypothetical protein [Streptomyces cyaneofuscatus]|uniref:hypothetical protein n=1 Tax=Streptomyces cyaneofuscatus TaxID=66883 RepID=UPI002E0D29EF|nr:hypothetical protein OG366_27795 [Streptomyces cyaneofuscatus]WTF34958.1 hypothetical protein OG973_08900 [Streptomyces cyaneofuscatus]
MGWTYKVHGGVAAGSGAVVLALAVLAWVPGTAPVFEPQWVVPTAFLPAFLMAMSAFVRVLLVRSDKSELWQAFRCLPSRAQAGLAALVVACAIVLAAEVVAGGSRDVEVREGSYFAYDLQAHRMVEVAESEYQALLPGSRRMFLAVSGGLLIGASCLVLAAGEVRRADRGPLVPKSATAGVA